MAHLKKLSDRLRVASPAVLEIITLSSLKANLLGKPGLRINQISRRISQFLVPSLRLTASHHQLAALSAPQVGLNAAIFVMNRYLVSPSWNGYKSDPNDYAVYINPIITNYTLIQKELWEECCSVPKARVKVPRYDMIELRYLDESGTEETQTLKGFTARVAQHEIDHLKGLTILNLSVSQGEFEHMDPEVDKLLSQGDLEEHYK